MLDPVSTEVIDALPPGLLDILASVHQDPSAEVLADMEDNLAGIDSHRHDLLYAAHARVLAALQSVGHRDSVRHGLELVSLAERMDRNEFRCHAHSELAEAYRLLGVLERAVTHLREALRFASMSEADQTALPFLRLGLTYLALERPADALACLERARNSFLHLGLVSNAAEALVGEARALLAFGQTGEALQRLERAEAGLRLAEAEDEMPLVYRLMGEAMATQGAAAKAAAHFRLALRLHEQGHGQRFEADTYLAFASFQLDRGDPYTARTTLEHALELFRSRGDTKGQAQAIRMLGQVFESAGDFASALASLKQHLQLRSDIEQEASEQEGSLRVMQLERSITREYASARVSQAALVDANRVLREQASRLEQLSKTDYLTGLYNRRYLTKHLEAEFSSTSSVAGLSLILIDIDDFKSVNDRYGHDFGDRILEQLAHILVDTFRPEDIVSRWGGEEFAVAVPALNCGEATAAAEHARSMVENHDWSQFQPGLRITISVGVACALEPLVQTLQDLHAVADRRMYMGKETGRNRVVGQDSAVPA